MIIETLDIFLKQAQTEELATKGKRYLNSYNDCKVKISFGKGRISNVPWIAFLRGNNEIRCGIYPVILYYKKIQKLVIAFGIGTYFETDKEWKFDDKYKFRTIKSELGDKYDGVIPYNKCFVYSYYRVNGHLNLKNIQNDIDSVIGIYKKYNAK
jgi:5-methylcytosine-specific restriction protein B